MKKVFFSFAIATVMAGLVACNGSSNQNTNGQDSTAVETEAEIELLPGTEYEGAGYTLTLPEGWTEGQYSTPENLEAVYFDEATNTKSYVYVHPYTELTDAAATVKRLSNAEEQPDVTLGDYTWKSTKNDDQIFLAMDMPEKGVMYVRVVNTDIKNVGVQTILRTFKLK
jgi:hypothetical protein